MLSLIVDQTIKHKKKSHFLIPMVSPVAAILGTTALLDDHVRNGAVDDAIAQIKVQQLDRAHLLRRAARNGRSAQLHHVGVLVLGQEAQHTLAGTVGRLVALRSDDPVPAELFKVHRQRVAAAAGFVVVLVAVQREVPLDALLRRVAKFDLDVGGKFSSIWIIRHDLLREGVECLNQDILIYMGILEPFLHHIGYVEFDEPTRSLRHLAHVATHFLSDAGLDHFTNRKVYHIFRRVWMMRPNPILSVNVNVHPGKEIITVIPFV